MPSKNLPEDVAEDLLSDFGILDPPAYMRQRVVLECRRQDHIEIIQNLRELYANSPRDLDQAIRTFIQQDILQNDLIWPATRELFTIAWGKGFYVELTLLARLTLEKVLAQKGNQK